MNISLSPSWTGVAISTAGSSAPVGTISLRDKAGSFTLAEPLAKQVGITSPVAYTAIGSFPPQEETSLDFSMSFDSEAEIFR